MARHAVYSLEIKGNAAKFIFSTYMAGLSELLSYCVRHSFSLQKLLEMFALFYSHIQSYLMTTICFALLTPARRRSSGCRQFPCWYIAVSYATHQTSYAIIYKYKVNFRKHVDKFECLLSGQRRAKQNDILQFVRFHMRWSVHLYLAKMNPSFVFTLYLKL